MEKPRKTTGRRFFKGNKNLPPKDFFYCLDYNKFDFVLGMEKRGDKQVLKKYMFDNHVT